MLNIDDEYLDLLTAFMKVIEGPDDMAVAGGAIRDMLFDKEVKDIDVFYTGEITKIPKEYKAKECDTKYDGSSFTLTHEIPACNVVNIPVPIQFIQVESIDEIIANFPSNICRCALFRDDGLYIDQDLPKAASKKQHDYLASKLNSDHYLRLRAKYSDWDCFISPLYNFSPPATIKVPF